MSNKDWTTQMWRSSVLGYFGMARWFYWGLFGAVNKH